MIIVFSYSRTTPFDCLVFYNFTGDYLYLLHSSSEVSHDVLRQPFRDDLAVSLQPLDVVSHSLQGLLPRQFS